MSRARLAFTITEMLIIIAIVAVLVAMLLPVLTRARERSRQITCMGNQALLYQALDESVNSTNGIFPGQPNAGVPTAWRDALHLTLGTTSSRLWRCPSNLTTDRGEADYGMNFSLSGQKREAIRDPEHVILLADAAKALLMQDGDIDLQRHQGGALMTFLDGHQEIVSQAGKPIITDEGVPGKLICFGATGTIIAFGSGERQEIPALADGDIVLLRNASTTLLTIRYSVSGGAFPARDSLLQSSAASTVLLDPGMTVAFRLQCMVGLNTHRVDTLYTFVDGPVAVTCFVRAHQAP